MSTLKATHYFVEFSAASKRARQLAIEYKTQVALCRNENGWNILVPEAIASQMVFTGHADDYLGPELHDDLELDGERDLIWQEIVDDQESWARSDEEGWFYGDD